MVAFQTNTDYQKVTGIKRRMCAYLAEDQAIFIGTLSRNTDQVIRFKVKLVKSFSAARKALSDLAKPKNTLDLMQMALDELKQHDRRLSDAENKLMEIEARVDADPTIIQSKRLLILTK